MALFSCVKFTVDCTLEVDESFSDRTTLLSLTGLTELASLLCLDQWITFTIPGG